MAPAVAKARHAAKLSGRSQWSIGVRSLGEDHLARRWQGNGRRSRTNRKGQRRIAHDSKEYSKGLRHSAKRCWCKESKGCSLQKQASFIQRLGRRSTAASSPAAPRKFLTKSLIPPCKAPASRSSRRTGNRTAEPQVRIPGFPRCSPVSRSTGPAALDGQRPRSLQHDELLPPCHSDHALRSSTLAKPSGGARRHPRTLHAVARRWLCDLGRRLPIHHLPEGRDQPTRSLHQSTPRTGS